MNFISRKLFSIKSVFTFNSQLVTGRKGPAHFHPTQDSSNKKFWLRSFLLSLQSLLWGLHRSLTASAFWVLFLPLFLSQVSFLSEPLVLLTLSQPAIEDIVADPWGQRRWGENRSQGLEGLHGTRSWYAGAEKDLRNHLLVYFLF